MTIKTIALVLLTFSATLQAESLKIGYINIDHVVSSSPQFIQANQSVIKEFKPQEEQLLLLSQKIQLLADDFNKNSKALTQSERKSEIKKIANLERQLKQQASSLKNQLTLTNLYKKSTLLNLKTTLCMMFQ